MLANANGYNPSRITVLFTVSIILALLLSLLAAQSGAQGSPGDVSRLVSVRSSLLFQRVEIEKALGGISVQMQALTLETKKLQIARTEIDQQLNQVEAALRKN